MDANVRGGWDIDNHITLVQLPAGGRNTMTYGGDGKRRRTEDSDALRNVVWDAENILLESDSGGSAVARYTLAPEMYGSLVSQRRGGATAFHHFDALGSTRALTNSAQTATDSRDYKAFGLTNGSSGSSANRFWWVGRLGYYSQPDTADYWVRANTVLPVPGRWQTRDELCYRGNVIDGNCYQYAGNSPTVRFDPSGLECQSAHGCKCQDIPVQPVRPLHPTNSQCDLNQVWAYLRFVAKMADHYCSKAQGAAGMGVSSHGEALEGCRRYAGCTMPEIPANVVAFTICCEECGRCKPLTYPGPLYFGLSGCIQTCYIQHEQVHRGDCLGDNMRPGKGVSDSECDAYETTLNCLLAIISGKP